MSDFNLAGLVFVAQTIYTLHVILGGDIDINVNINIVMHMVCVKYVHDLNDIYIVAGAVLYLTSAG